MAVLLLAGGHLIVTMIVNMVAVVWFMGQSSDPLIDPILKGAMAIVHFPLSPRPIDSSVLGTVVNSLICGTGLALGVAFVWRRWPWRRLPPN